jgi:hypothetical protein
MVKSRRISRAENVAKMGEKINVNRILLEKA